MWSNGEWLEYDLKGESEAVKAERMWSEAALQAQRRNNARCDAQKLHHALTAVHHTESCKGL